MKIKGLMNQIDYNFTKSKTGKLIKKWHHRAMRRADKVIEEDYPSNLPYNRYKGWVS